MKPEFPIYLEKRHYLWFRSTNAQIHCKSMCQKDMPQTATLVDFKCCPYWQRKLSNKWNARLLAEKMGVPVPELYWYGTPEQIEQIPFESLPENYVIKPTSAWSCMGVFVIKKGVNLFDYKSYTPEQLKAALKKIAQRFPTSNFMIEEMVTDEQGSYQIPIDFKCHLFAGQLESILAIRRKDGHSGWAAFYDRNWQHKGGSLANEPTLHIAPYQKEIISKPKCLQQIIKYAEVLGSFYGSFVRIDFYATAKGAIFGEFTPFPNSGGNYNLYADTWLNKWRSLDPKIFESKQIGDNQIKLYGVQKLISTKSEPKLKPKPKTNIQKKDQRKKRTFS